MREGRTRGDGNEEGEQQDNEGAGRGHLAPVNMDSTCSLSVHTARSTLHVLGSQPASPSASQLVS